MYLDKLLGSKTKVNLLSVLVSHPERSIIESELAKEAGVAVSYSGQSCPDWCGERAVYDKYLSLATELHMVGYQPNQTFSAEELKGNLKFAQRIVET